MWQKACKRISYSVQAVLLETREKGSKAVRWDNVGTSFAIGGKTGPFFITSAHVVCDLNGKPCDPKRLALSGHINGKKAVICGVGIVHIDQSIDIAVLEGSREGEAILPVTFAGPNILSVGTPVASMGYPIPAEPELTESGGHLTTARRLATGFVSAGDSLPEFDSQTAKLNQYEINMFSYPGLSGAPVFNLDGRVIGMNRGSLELRGHEAAYAYAVRGVELVKWLKIKEVGFKMYRESMWVKMSRRLSID